MSLTRVPEELLRLTPSDLEKMKFHQLKTIRVVANRLYFWLEDEADKVLVQGVMEMVNREMERRLSLYEERLG